eukprot:6354859-Amphidinium_carterae.1
MDLCGLWSLRVLSSTRRVPRICDNGDVVPLAEVTKCQEPKTLRHALGTSLLNVASSCALAGVAFGSAEESLLWWLSMCSCASMQACYPASIQ